MPEPLAPEARVHPQPSPQPSPETRDPFGVPALTWFAWALCLAGAAASLAVGLREPVLKSVAQPSLALLALPYALLVALAWWGRRTATARWVALAGVVCVFALGAALWLAWAEVPLARLAAPRMIPGRQLVAVAVVAYVVSLARRARI